MTETETAPGMGAGISQGAPKRGVPLWAQIIVWVALLGLLTVVALGLRRTQQGTVQVGDTIPEFTLSFFDGYQYQGKSEVKLSELKGKIIVVNFWASWCKPCEQEAAEMEAAWRFYEPAGQVVFIGADYVDTEPEARGYLKKFAITYPNGPDLGTRISQMFRIQGVPETYFIDQTGKLVYAQIGPFSSEAEIHAIIDPLIKK
jgi:cytochrome c biogenesis protein CcmG/thiol:disulfide interchange protein DsbE